MPQNANKNLYLLLDRFAQYKREMIKLKQDMLTCSEAIVTALGEGTFAYGTSLFSIKQHPDGKRYMSFEEIVSL